MFVALSQYITPYYPSVFYVFGERVSSWAPRRIVGLSASDGLTGRSTWIRWILGKRNNQRIPVPSRQEERAMRGLTPKGAKIFVTFFGSCFSQTPILYLKQPSAPDCRFPRV
jgi:hypothetical protein